MANTGDGIHITGCKENLNLLTDYLDTATAILKMQNL